MAAIVSGTGLGLMNTSLRTLGDAVSSGSAVGANGSKAYINAANGNLLLQSQDEFLAAANLNPYLMRTYNSQGQASDASGSAGDGDNGDNWRLGAYAKVFLLTGTVNTTGSTVTRVTGDGATEIYTFDATAGRYISKAGAGAYDSLSWNAAAGASPATWRWTDGSTQSTEMYNAAGLMTSSQDASGNATSFAYNTANLLISMTAASGDVTQFDYVGKNLSAIRVISQGRTETATRYTYDNANRLSSVKIDLSPDDDSIADNNIYLTSYTYDGTSTRIAGMTQSDGTSLAFTYTLAGGVYRLASMRDALAHVTSWTYNTSSRTTTMTDPVGAVTKFIYDASGQLLSITAPKINDVSPVTTYTYDTSGNVTKIVNANAATQTMTYDVSGNQLTLVDGVGNTTANTYDSGNRLLTRTLRPSTTSTTQSASTNEVSRYVYDNAGRLRFDISAAGRVVEYRYDSRGQRTAQLHFSQTAYDISSLGATSVPTLDQMASWSAAQDADLVQRADYKYDFRGQLTSTRGEALEVSTYVRDQHGNLLQTIDARGASTSYTYDGLNRVLVTTDTLGNQSVTQYDDAHGKTITIAANGLRSVSIFSADGKLTSVIKTDSTGNTELGTTRYSYDAAGRLIALRDPLGLNVYYFYDALGRSAGTVDSAGALTENAYDKNGNLVSETRYATAVDPTLLADADGNPINPSMSALEPATSYDDRITRNTYDADNRLIWTIDPAGYGIKRTYDSASRLTGVYEYSKRPTVTVTDTAKFSVSTPSTTTSDRNTRIFYDADGLVTGKLDAERYLTQHQYDASGNRIATVAYASATAVATGTLESLIPAATVNDIVQRFFYDAHGRQVGVLDGNGFLTETRYDANGNAVAVTRYANPAAAYTAGAGLAAVRPIVSALDRTESTSYTTFNQVANHASADGAVTRYEYNSAGVVVAVSTAAATDVQRTERVRVDLQGRVVARLSANAAALLDGNTVHDSAIWNAHAQSYVYDADDRLIAETDAAGNKTVYFYDSVSRLTHTVNALGEVHGIAYDVYGDAVTETAYAGRLGANGLTGGNNAAIVSLLATIADPLRDSTVTSAFDASGKAVSLTDALGNVTTREYSAFGNLTREVRPASGNYAVQYTYDRRGLQLSEADDYDGLRLTRKIQYDAFGRAIATTDAKGIAQAIRYDRSGRVIATGDGFGAMSGITYDAFDRVLTRQDKLGNVTTYIYDDLTHTTSVISAGGVRSSVQRDLHGQTIVLTDGVGSSTHYTYDLDGNLIATTDAAGVSANASFDAADRMVGSIDRNGILTTFSYDAAGRVLSEVVDAGGLALRTDYGFDAKGQTVSVSNANGVKTTTSYYLDGHVSRVTVDPAGLNLWTQYEYDSAGNKVIVTEGVSTDTVRGKRYDYDSANRLLNVRELDVPYATWYTYDVNGNVLTATTPGGKVTTYTYDANQRVLSCTDAAGKKTVYTYDANGKLATVTDPKAQITSYSYNADGLVASIRDALGATVVSTYNGNGQLATSTDANGHVTSYVYDSLQRLVSQTDALGHSTSYSYDENSNRTGMTDAAGRITVYSFDSANRLIAETGPTGGVSAYAYDAAGNLASVTDGNGNKLRYSYDAAGRQTGKTDAMGNATTRVYDAVGNVVAVTDPNGHTTRYEFNTSNLRTAMTDALGNVTTYDYDLDGNCLYVSHPLGNYDFVTYDAVGRILTEPNGRGFTTTYVYDAVGNRIKSSTDAPNGYNDLTNYTYDAGNRLIREKTAFSDFTYAYDSVGNRIRSTDIAGRATLYAYDALDRLISQTDPLGNVTSFTYDPVGNRASLTDANGHTSTYEYDAGNRLTSTTDALGHVTSQSFDSVGNRTSSTDAAGNVTQYAYDAANRLRLEIDPYGNSTSYSYDADGNRISRVDANGNAQNYQYDAGNRLIAVSDILGVAERYGYDAAGNRTSRTDGNGNVTQFEFDNLHRLTGSNDPLAILHTLQYSWNSVEEFISNSSGALSIKSTYFDAAGRLSETVTESGASTKFMYDLVGDLISQTDSNGNKTLFSYDASHRLIKTTQPTGAFTTFTYDNVGNLLTSTDALGRVSSNQYDAGNRLISTTDPLGNVTSYGYDAANRQTAVTDPNGNVTRRLYDANGHLATETDAIGNVRRFVYDPVGNLSGVIDQRGNAINYNYDQRNRLIRESDRLGVRAVYIYDAVGNKTRVVDANGNATKYEYNAGNQMVLSTDAIGNLTAYTYDSYGDLRTTTEANGDVSTTYIGYRHEVQMEWDARNNYSFYDYDLNGNLLRRFSPFTSKLAAPDRTYTYDAENRLTSDTGGPGGDMSYRYDKVGNLTSQTDALGHVTTYAYDADNRRIGQTDALGNVTLYGYDSAGNQVSVIDPKGHTTTFTYDADKRLIGLTDALGHTTTYGYDASGNRISVTDANGHSTRYSYDARNQLIAVTDASGKSTQTAYDGAGNRIASTDANGKVTTFSYDADNRLVSTRDPLGNATAAVYDSIGNLIRQIDGLGNTTTFAYLGHTLTSSTDPLGVRTTFSEDGSSVTTTLIDGEVSSVHYFDGLIYSREGSDGRSISYAYDAANNLIELQNYDAGNVTSYAYDAGNRLLSETVNTTDITTYQYDAAGNRTVANRGNTVIARYEYDAANRLTSETDALGHVTLYGYDAVGNMVTKTDGNGHLRIYEYDVNNRLIAETDPLGNVTRTTYDGKGNRTSVTDGSGAVTRYEYDDLNRLMALFTPGGSASYSYDAAGNRIAQTDGNGNTTRFTYDAGRRLLTSTTPDGAMTSYAYSVTGKRITEADAGGHVVRYLYDEYGELTSVIDAFGRSTTVAESHSLYGRRVDSLSPGGIASSIKFDGYGRVIEESNGHGATSYYEYNNQGKLVSETLDYDGYTRYSYDSKGQLLSKTDPVGLVTSYTYDGVGNRTTVTDPSGHTTHYAYDAADRLLSESDALGHTVVYGYDGAGRRTSVTDANGHATTYAYDGDGRLSAQTNPLGDTVRYAYDNAGNRISVTDADGDITRYTFDALNRISTQTDPLGQTTRYFYDQLGNLVRLLDPSGASHTSTYDAANRIASETDSLGNTTTYAYDADGNRTSATDANGVVTRFRFASSHDQNRQTDALGRNTDFTWDRLGHVTSIIGPVVSTIYSYDADGRVLSESADPGRTWTYAYDGAGNRTSATDDNGHITRYQYDAANRLTGQTDAYGVSTGYTLDAVGNRTAATDASGRTTHYGYDASNRLISETDPAGNVTAYGYDADGRRNAVTDANGNRSTSTFNADGHLVATTDALGKVTTFDYDAAGNRIASTDSLGNITESTYDGEHRLLAQRGADGSLTRYAYDKVGNLLSQTLASGTAAERTTSWTYDAAHRKLTQTDAAGLTRYEYDSRDNVRKITQPQGVTTTLTYNDAGQLVSRSDSPGLSSYYTYDADGRLLVTSDSWARTETRTYGTDGRLYSSVQKDGNGNLTTTLYNATGDIVSIAAGGFTTQFFYDAAGRKIATIDGDGYRTDFVLDGVGNVIASTQQIDHEGTSATVRHYFDAGNHEIATLSAEGFLTTMQYDGEGRLITRLRHAIAVAVPAGGAPVAAAGDQGALTRYVYDVAGRLIASTDENGATVRHTYDMLGRLQTDTDSRGEVTSHDYDALGRLVASTIGAGTPAQRTTSWQYDELGRVSFITDALGSITARTYDARGRLITETSALGTSQARTIRTTYDGNNQALTVRNDSLPGELTMYDWDALGRRSMVRTSIGGRTASTTYHYNARGQADTTTDAMGMVTRLRYDGAGNLLESVEASGVPGMERRTIYRYDLDGRLVAVTDPTGAQTLFTLDGAGRRLTVTDALGRVTRNIYDSAGVLLSTLAADGMLTTYGYQMDGLVATVRVSDTSGGDARVTSYRYDASRRMTVSTDALGYTTTLTYDAYGNIASATTGQYLESPSDAGYDAVAAALARPVTTTKEWNANGQLLAATDGMGNRTMYSYDAHGNRTAMSEPGDPVRITTYQYDQGDRLTGTTSPNGAVISYEYKLRTDKPSRQTQLNRDGEALVTDFTYDNNGRLLTEAVTGGLTTTYTWDVFGNRTGVDVGAHGATEVHDADGRLLSRTDGEGNRVEYAYDAVGNAISSTDANGNTTHMWYNGANRITASLDARGALISHQYDIAGNRTSERRYAVRYTGAIDPANAPVLDSTAQDRVVRFIYDRAGRQMASVDPDGVQTNYKLDAAGNQIEIEVAGRTVSNSYDAVGRVLQHFDADGVMTDFSYDLAGNLVSETVSTAGVGRRTSYTYDLDGRRLSTIVDPDGLALVSTKRYNDLGHVTGSTDGANRSLSYHYDSAGRADFTLNAAGAVVASWQYDAAGNLSYSFGTDGPAWYAYDRSNRLTAKYFSTSEVSDIAGGVHSSDGRVSYRYDGNGNLVQTTDANGFKINDYFDQANQLVARLDGDNVLHQFDYDMLGDRTSERLYMTRMVDDARSVITAPLSPAGAVRQYTYQYDNSGRELLKIYPAVALSELSGPNGNSPSLATVTRAPEEIKRYDAFGNQVESIAIDGGRTLTYYDQRNRPVAQVDAMGYLVQTDYDVAGNVVQTRAYANALDVAMLGDIAPHSPGGQVQVTSYLYDAANRQTAMRTSAVMVAEQFNGNADLNQSSQTIVTLYAYDGAGNLVRQTNAAGTIAQQVLYYYYDDNNVQLAAIDAVRGLTLYRHDSQNRITAAVRFARPVEATTNLGAIHADYGTFLALASRSADDQATFYTFNSQGRLIDRSDAMSAVTVSADTNGLVVSSSTLIGEVYRYDAAGNRSYVRDANGNVTQSQYDAMGRTITLLQADGSGTRQEFDAAGNVVYRYTGEVASHAVVANAIAASIASDALLLDYNVGAVGVRSWVVWDTRSHDIGSAGAVSVYAGQSTQSSSTTTAAHAAIALPAAGAVLFYRVVTADSAGNLAYTEELKVSIPAPLLDLQTTRLASGSVQIKVAINGAAASPTLFFGIHGSTNASVLMRDLGAGYFAAEVSGLDPDALGFKVQWRDSAGTLFTSAEQSIAPAAMPFSSSTVTHESPSNGGARLELSLSLPPSAADRFELVTASWRIAGGGDSFLSSGAAGDAAGNYSLVLGNLLPLQLGVAYEIVINGVAADGATTFIDGFQYTPSGISHSVAHGIAISLSGGHVGTPLVILDGKPALNVASNSNGNIVLRPLAATGVYSVYYTAKASGVHTTSVASSQWNVWQEQIDANGVDHGYYKLSGYNLAFSTHLPSDEAEQAGRALHVSVRVGDGAYVDTVMTADGNGNYTYALNHVDLPPRAVDYKVWYLDNQGREVIVDWDSTSIASTTTRSGQSDVVLSGEVNGSFNGVAVNRGARVGTLAAVAAATVPLSITRTGLAGGFASTSPLLQGYYEQSVFNALNGKVAGTGTDGVWTEYDVDATGHAVGTRMYGQQGNPDHIDSYASYDLRGRQVAKFGALFALADGSTGRPVTRALYDFMNQLVASTDAAGQTSTWQYDLLGHQVEYINALGHGTSTAWDAMGRIVCVTDVNGATGFTQYDTGGNRMATIDATGVVASEEHDLFGRLVATTDGNGKRTAYSYDQLSRLKSQGDLAFEYDANGNRTAQHDLGDPNGNRHETTYDALGRVAMVSAWSRVGDVDQKLTNTSRYDAFGNMVAQIDGNGKVQQNIYEGYGRLVGRIDSSGARIDIAYDTFGRKSAETGGGRQIAYRYDSAGHLGAIEDIATKATTLFGYDIAGRQVSQIVTSTADIFGSVHTRQLDTAYDALGRMTHWKDQVTGLEETITYDNVGNRIRVQGSGGGADVDHGTGYDAAGRVTALRDHGAVIASYTYDAAGNRATYTANGVTTVYQYDSANRPRFATTGDNVVEWQYDRAGNLTQYRETLAGVTQKSVVTVFDSSSHALYTKTDTRDASGKLQGQEMTQKFNGAGQVVSATLHTYGEAEKTYYYLYAYTADGRQQTVRAYGSASGNASFTYDVNGNVTMVNQGKGDGLTREEVSNYVFDNAGHILAKYHDDGKAATLRDRIDYVYDVNGNPVGNSGISIAAAGQVATLDTGNYALFQDYDTSFPAGTVQPYIVQAGDTLEIIASAVYGNHSLWYLLADANGFQRDTALHAGQVISAPLKSASGVIDSETHTVYQQSDLVGGTLPNLTMPPPSNSGCSGILKILVVVVAVVVTVYTAGAASSLVAGSGSFGATLTAGASVLSGGAAGGTIAGVTSAMITAAAVGGAVGSIASQGFAMAVGLQDSFNWKGVALSALGAGVASGVGAIGGFASGAVGAAQAAATGNAITQGISVLTGLQDKFDWRSVAASAAAAGTATVVSDLIGAGQYGKQWEVLKQRQNQLVLQADIVNNVVRQTVTNVASGLVQEIVATGKVDWRAAGAGGIIGGVGHGVADYLSGVISTYGAAAKVATDAFGNALGSSLAESLGAKAEQLSNSEKAGPISRAQAERNLYGGLTRKEVLGGEKDWLGALGTYEGDIGNGGAARSWDEDMAARRAANPGFEAPVPQVIINGTRMTPDEKLASLFGLDRKIVFSQASAPSRIEAQQSIWSTYSNIAGAYRSNKIGLGDAVSMAWNNTKFAYRGSERTQGGVQALNGALEVGGAIAISGTGVGAVIGVPLAAHGGDNIGTGLSRMWTGQAQDTVTYNSVRSVTGSDRAAQFVDTAIPMLGGVVAVGAGVNALRLEAKVALDPNRINFSQATISYKGGSSYTLDETFDFASNGGRLPRIDVVQSESGALMSIDNRRVFIGRQVGDDYQGYTLDTRIRLFDEPLNLAEVERFTLQPLQLKALSKRGFTVDNPVPSTWGQAAQLRVLSQETRTVGRGFSTQYPNGSPNNPLISGGPR